MKIKSSDIDPKGLRGSVARFLDGFPGDTICLRQIWYEGTGGCGTPSPADMDEMRAAVDSLDTWKPIGNIRHEKYGVQFTFQRVPTDSGKPAPEGGKGSKKSPSDIMVQHLFKLNSLHRTPDGRIFKIVVSEVYNLRCFEVADGKLVGGMVKIHPSSDFAKSLVEVTN